MPNGFEADGTTPKFDEVVIASDVTSGFISSTDRDVLVYLNMNNNTLGYNTNVTETHSGTSAPSGVIQYHVWYDTANNIVKMTVDKGVTWTTGYSLPIALVKLNSSSVVTSIDQIFNGFGYIGSTVFVTKGVKGLIPNGRNEDRTLKNIEFTVEKIRTFQCTHTGTLHLRINGASTQIGYLVYLEDKNWNTRDEQYRGYMVAGTVTATSGVISNLDIKQPFRALDYNDKREITGWGMPSGKVVELTLGASETKYTAPANGYFVLNKKSSANSRQYMSFYTGKFSVLNETSTSGSYVVSFFPCAKGAQVGIDYNLGGDTIFFGFVYAEGEV